STIRLFARIAATLEGAGSNEERKQLPRGRSAMMIRAMILGWLLCGIVGLARPGMGAEKQSGSVLAGAPALEQPVTYSETKIALVELVRKVAADTGVPLAVAKDVADEPVAVVVKGLPARELLEQIAALLDYQWRPREGDGGQGYLICQDEASRQREKAL